MLEMFFYHTCTLIWLFDSPNTGLCKADFHTLPDLSLVSPCLGTSSQSGGSRPGSLRNLSHTVMHTTWQFSQHAGKGKISTILMICCQSGGHLVNSACWYIMYV